MTVLELLRSRTDFQANPAAESVEGLSLPEDVLAFYREADGGWGYLESRDWAYGSDIRLYSRAEMGNLKQWFLDFAANRREELHTMEERPLNEKEQAQLDRIGSEIILLGECGDQDFPEYLCLYKDFYFRKDHNNLDFLFEEGWKPEAEETVIQGSFLEFLNAVLWHMEEETL